MSVKRIFSPSVANYLLQNGATLKEIARNQLKNGEAMFLFEQNDKLNELLANRK